MTVWSWLPPFSTVCLDGLLRTSLSIYPINQRLNHRVVCGSTHNDCWWTFFARDVEYWYRCRAHMGYVLYRALVQVDNQSTDQEACKLNLWGQANHANAACPVINVLFKLRCSDLELEKKLQKKWILTICWPLLGDSLTSTRPLPCRGWSWWMPHVDWNSAVSLLSACWHVSIQLVSLWIHLLHWRLYFGWYVLKILHSVQVLWLHILFSVPPYSVFAYTE